METDGSVQHSLSQTPTHCLVEEEYTIGVPLVRPKPAFLNILRLAGAHGEVFTQKEICLLLKDYIGSRQLYDPNDPRVVNCGGDILGEVFGLKSFTIEDVLNLLTRHCTAMPDTCLKKKRHLVAKPLPSLHNGQQSSVMTCASQQVLDPRLSASAGATGQPVVQSFQPGLPITTPAIVPPSVHLPNLNQPTSNQQSVISSSIIQPLQECKPLHKSSSKQDNNCQFVRYAASASAHRKSSSSSNDSHINNSVSTQDAGNQSLGCPGNQSVVTPGTQSDADSSTSSNVPFKTEEPLSKSKKRKRKKKRESKENGSRRKRHHTEPTSTEQASPGSSQPMLSRRRGTSLSITYTDTLEGDHYPCYFEVELGDDDDDGEEEEEVLSVQDRETVSVRDSTDDLWFLEEDSIEVEVDSDTEIALEYDIQSDNSVLSESDLSSIRSGQGFLVVCKESDVEFFADYSDTDSNMGDRELSEADNWTCVDCKQVNEPLLRHCSKCWKLRSDWLPSRTPSQRYLDRSAKPGLEKYDTDKLSETNDDLDSLFRTVKETKDVFDSGFGSLSSTQETVLSQESVDNVDNEKVCRSEKLTSLKPPCVPDFDANHKSFLQESQDAEVRFSLSNYQMEKSKSSSSLESSDSQMKSISTKYTSGVVQPSQTNPMLEPCIICLSKAKTASLVHGGTGHQVCCFECGKRMKRRGKMCPVCRRPIQKVIRNYIL